MCHVKRDNTHSQEWACVDLWVLAGLLLKAAAVSQRACSFLMLHVGAQGLGSSGTTEITIFPVNSSMPNKSRHH